MNSKTREFYRQIRTPVERSGRAVTWAVPLRTHRGLPHRRIGQQFEKRMAPLLFDGIRTVLAEAPRVFGVRKTARQREFALADSMFLVAGWLGAGISPSFWVRNRLLCYRSRVLVSTGRTREASS